MRRKTKPPEQSAEIRAARGQDGVQRVPDQPYRAWARSDPNFDPIRADPAFRRLVYGE